MSHSTIPIPRSNIRRSNQVYTLWDLLQNEDIPQDDQSDDGSREAQPRYFDSREGTRNKSTLKFRIPEHQRWPRWGVAAQRKLVDSVFQNMPMQGITFSQHIDTNAPVGEQEYYDIEDGQTRLSILQAFYNNKFAWYDDRTFRELGPNQQQRFKSYKLNAEIIANATEDQIHEIFERCQEGKPLRDCDKFWNRKKKSVVQFAYDLIRAGAPRWRHKYMGTSRFGTQNRARLSDVVGLTAALVCEGGKDYITSSFRRLHPKLDTVVNAPAIHKIYTFLRFYFKIIDTAYMELPLMEIQYSDHAGTIKTRNERRLQFWHIGGYLGMILWDYLLGDEVDAVKQARWVQIINIDRQVPNFMRGAQTLWNGLSREKHGVTKNGSKIIAARVERIRAFSASEEMGNRDAYCDKLGIIWYKNDDDSSECGVGGESIGERSSGNSSTTVVEFSPVGDNLEAVHLDIMAVSAMESTTPFEMPHPNIYK